MPTQSGKRQTAPRSSFTSPHPSAIRARSRTPWTTPMSMSSARYACSKLRGARACEKWSARRQQRSSASSNICQSAKTTHASLTHLTALASSPKRNIASLMRSSTSWKPSACATSTSMVPISANCMLRGRSLTIYDVGEQTRDLVNVQDVARANVLAAQARGESDAFNIASGEAITVNRLVELMREASGIEPTVNNSPPRKGDVRHSRADISAAHGTFGYQPAVKLPEGLAEYMAWARSNLF